MPALLFPDNADSALIDCEWLRGNMRGSDWVILDATFFLPRQQRNACAEFATGHIEGAQFFDIDAIADRESPLPHTLPNAAQFARQVGRLGIGNRTWVCIYDRNHFFASARAWWMFRVFGHDRVKILNGGLARWQQLGFPLTDTMTPPKHRPFSALFRANLYTGLEQMQTHQKRAETQILDARSEDNFSGSRPLQEPGLRAGHIPGSLNMPYRKLFDPEDHRLLPLDDLRHRLASAGVDLARPLVATCGSGVSAALLLLALYELEVRGVPLYDGSWAEWGRRMDLPAERG